MPNGDVETVRSRRDAWTLRSNPPWDPMTEYYARAVGVMQGRASNDPTSWVYRAGIHGSYAPPPTGSNWNECQHSSWHFLSWHRMYLYYFERIVRAAVVGLGGPSDWALPYWNYEQPAPFNSLPEPFRVPALPDGAANPLFLPAPARSPAIAQGFGISPQVASSSAAFAQIAFSSAPGGTSFGGGRLPPAHFGSSRGQLEQSPHNGVHTQVGGAGDGACGRGLMADPNCAALDPIFWLHHANIDRVWDEWLAGGGGRANPTEAAWLQQTFDFHDETGALVRLSGADVLDTAAQLAYDYQ